VTLPFLAPGAAYCDALIEQNVVPDFSRFTYNDPHAVIDEQTLPDGRARVNLNPGKQAGHMRYCASNNELFTPVQPVRHLVEEYGMQPRVAEQDLECALGRRILSLNRLNLVAERHGSFYSLPNGMPLSRGTVLGDSLKLTMPDGYLMLFGFAVAAILLPLVALGVGRLLRPSRPNAAKLEAYECGIPPESDARGRYSVRFYLVAMLFVIFDVETVLLFPWALRYKQLGWFGVAEAGVFLAFLVIGYVWIFRKGVLEWT